MLVFTLTILMQHGSVTYGYYFAEKENCIKVGREIASVVKGSFACKRIKK